MLLRSSNGSVFVLLLRSSFKWCVFVFQSVLQRTAKSAVVHQTNASNAKLAIKRTRKDNAVCLYAICDDRYWVYYQDVYIWYKGMSDGIWITTWCCFNVNFTNFLLLTDGCTGSPLIQIMACRLFRTKPLCKPVMTYHQPHHREQASMKK